MIDFENYDCKIFTDNIEPEALETVWKVAKSKEFEGQKIRIMPDCLTEDSEILTLRGFIKIVDLLPTDRIGNYNPITSKVEFHEPKAIINRPLKLNEKVFRYENKRGYSFTVSENHRLALRTNLGETAKNISEFFTKDYFFNAKGIDNPINNYSDNDIRILCWIIGDGYIKTVHNQKSDNKRIAFGLKKKRKISRIIQLFEEEGYKFSEYNSSRQTEIYLSTKDSKKFINWIGQEKNFPKDLIQISSYQAEIFFEELIQVDGDYETYINTGKHSYRISSKNLDTLNLIGAIASINGRVSKTTSRIIKKGYIENTNLSYINIIEEKSTIFSKGGLHNSKFIRSEIPYDGNLVCVETNTGYFIARQNGFTFVTGNCHQGKGIVIGFSSSFGEFVSPSFVGCDIGCTVSAQFYSIPLKPEQYALFEMRVKRDVPMGFDIHNKRMFDLKDFLKFLRSEGINFYSEDELIDWVESRGMDIGVFFKSIGTVGGGNHFVEYGEGEDGKAAVFVHTGSRNFGQKIWKLHQHIADSDQIGKNDKKRITAEVKARVKDKKKIKEELDKALEEFKASKHPGYLTGVNLDNYLFDMKMCQAYAKWNHKIIHKIIEEIYTKITGAKATDYIQTHHNYIDVENRIIRKGAVSAQEGEIFILPLNMRDGIAICEGLGNPDWNYSCSHGAGRKLSRSKAKESLKMKDFEKAMEGIYTTSISRSTLDESPMAYKDSEEILELIQPTAKILYRILPKINIKSGEENDYSRKG